MKDAAAFGLLALPPRDGQFPVPPSGFRTLPVSPQHDECGPTLFG